MTLGDWLIKIKTKITNLTNDVTTLLGHDYIVEQGTSGNWTYEKWNSGKSVCYGRHTLYVNANRTDTYGYYSDPVDVNLPSDLFQSVLYYNCMTEGYNTWGSGYTITTTNVSFRLNATRPADYSSSGCVFDIEVKGRWK